MAATAAASMSGGATKEAPDQAADGSRPACCSLYHRAIELVGKRWTGAILLVLRAGPLHFSGIRHPVPELSDRSVNVRLKALAAEGIVESGLRDGTPVR